VRHKTKITVLKRMCNPDLAEFKASGSVEPCGHLEDGQEFVIDRWDAAPEGFCHWAWSDIHKEIMLVMGGGSNRSLSQEGMAIACCTDGFKPVVFKIERVEG
jgi:uncharacterized repeat protein (TIGR04076 family)